GGAATAIAEIRRAGGPSPLAGQTTSIEAVVTAAFGGADGLGGFFVQQADAQRRRRPGIPEGLFVYAPNARAAPGDLVHLTGKVDEQYGRTQFTLTGGMAVCARGQTAMPPVSVNCVRPYCSSTLPVRCTRSPGAARA
ncbi:hypothetical protein QM326_37485, partial [Burkholderia cenocepacia]|nr:hypothetical protein [Burkholderia cenocepacia]